MPSKNTNLLTKIIIFIKNHFTVGKLYLILILLVISISIIGDRNTSSVEVIHNHEKALALSENPEKSKININTAPKEVLMTLPGIGEKLADRIIEYRTANGGFEVIQDIIKVNGIGKKKFEEMRDIISVD